MKDILKHRPSDKNAYRFLLLILADIDRFTISKPEELTLLTGQLAALHSRGQVPFIDNPLSMYRVMYFLRQKGSPKMSEVANALSVSLPTATRIAEVLVNNGYAERLSDLKDGRLVRLTLTDYGRTAHDIIENFLPNQDCSSTKTPIEGLYVCGVSTYPGGLVLGGPGYLGANKVAEDLGVRKWWKPTLEMERYIKTYLE